jgi:hypothetical protein
MEATEATEATGDTGAEAEDTETEPITTHTIGKLEPMKGC